MIKKILALGTGFLLLGLSLAVIFGLDRLLNAFDNHIRGNLAVVSTSAIVAFLVIWILSSLYRRTGLSALTASPFARLKGVLVNHPLLTGGFTIVFFLAVMGLGQRLAFGIFFSIIASLFIILAYFFIEKKRHLYSISLIVILLFYLPFIYKGADSHIKIFDNLDCHIPQTKILAESGKAFSLNPSTKIDNFINGIQLSGLDSGYNVLTWLFMVFNPFTAYLLNKLLIAFVAFWGMVLLFRHSGVKTAGPHGQWIAAGVALCFALLPFYPAGGLSVAGLPLLAYAFINIRYSTGKWSDYLIILVFPFYSKLALSGIFVILTLLLLLLIDTIAKKRVHNKLAGAVFLLGLGYCFSHFHLVYSFLSPDFVSFREEIRAVGISTKAGIRQTFDNFIYDRVNVVGAQNAFIILAAGLAMGIGLIKKFRLKKLVLLVAGVMTTSILWGFKYWDHIMPLRQKVQLLNALDLTRFYWFNPFLWHLIFALSLLIIIRLKRGKLLVYGLIVGQLLFLFTNYNWEYRRMLGKRNSLAGSPLTYSLSFKEFYSQKLFSDIRKYIGRPQDEYRVVSLGLHPGISQFNGFYTLDFYGDQYPMTYKHAFRKIIEKELEKGATIKRVFDNNAKRCFLLVNEIHGNNALRGIHFSRGITKWENHLKIRNLNLNTGALKKMGGEYIFSAVEILNHRENQLQLEKVFENRQSPWRIYLYKVMVKRYNRELTTVE